MGLEPVGELTVVGTAARRRGLMWALMGIAGKLEAHFASAGGDLQLDATVTRMLDVLVIAA